MQINLTKLLICIANQQDATLRWILLRRVAGLRLLPTDRPSDQVVLLPRRRHHLRSRASHSGSFPVCYSVFLFLLLLAAPCCSSCLLDRPFLLSNRLLKFTHDRPPRTRIPAVLKEDSSTDTKLKSPVTKPAKDNRSSSRFLIGTGRIWMWPSISTSSVDDIVWLTAINGPEYWHHHQNKIQIFYNYFGIKIYFKIIFENKRNFWRAPELKSTHRKTNPMRVARMKSWQDLVPPRNSGTIRWRNSWNTTARFSGTHPTFTCGCDRIDKNE